MNLQTFKAPTMAEALQQVKTVMGGDAVILHTRTYQLRQWLGLKRREMVEITAGRGLNVARKQRAPVQSQSTAIANAPPAGYGPSFNKQFLPSAQPTISTAVQGSRQLLETPAAGNAIMLGITQDMTNLKEMVKDLLSESRASQAPQVPAELIEYFELLKRNQVDRELATEIVRALHKEIRPEYLNRPDFIKERLAAQVEKIIPVSGPIIRKRMNGPHIVALIGPTGVGKTTTLAKLAANLKLREKHKVGLITLDTYRIAATEQLSKYATILGAPVKVVNNGEDLKEAVALMQGMDFILIDTAGRSPRDVMKLNELRGILATINPDEVHLVISATAGQACAELAVQKFSEVRVDKVIFTKIDEAAHVGVVLNVARKVNLGLSYITTGQDVPDDIEVGRGKRLAELILGNGSL